LIELVSPQLLSVAEFTVPLAIALGSFALGLFFMFGANGIKSLKRLVFRKTSTAIDREK
jgi:hypothetical protein